MEACEWMRTLAVRAIRLRRGPSLDKLAEMRKSAAQTAGARMSGQQTKLDADTLAKARAAGLDKVIAEFPDCVADAARAAALDLADMPSIEGTSEPWPPMSVAGRR